MVRNKTRLGGKWLNPKISRYIYSTLMGRSSNALNHVFFSPGSSMYLWNLWGNIVLKLGTHVRFWIPPPPEFLGSFGAWTSKFRGHPQTTNKGTRLTLYTCNLLGRNKSKQLGFGSLECWAYLLAGVSVQNRNHPWSTFPNGSAEARAVAEGREVSGALPS